MLVQTTNILLLLLNIAFYLNKKKRIIEVSVIIEA